MTDTIPPQPTSPPPAPSEPPAEPAPTPTRRRLNPLAAGLIGLVLGAGIVGSAWAITANSHSTPGTFTLTGTFQLTNGAVDDGNGGCEGSDGYDDIRTGTAVTVYNAAGDVIATGALGGSTYGSPGCNFDVSVPDVPKGQGFYKVEVSHRGTLQLTAKQAENGEFAGTLG